MKYYYIKRNKRIGPFTLDELESHPLNPDTLVWHEGLHHWTPARAVTELSARFEALTPPPLPPRAPHYPHRHWPLMTGALSGVVVLLLVLLFWKRDQVNGSVSASAEGMVAPGILNKSDKALNTGTSGPQGPGTENLTIDFKTWTNNMGAAVIEGDVTNKATITTYNNVKLKTEYISSTGAILRQDIFALPDPIEPQGKEHFKHKFGNCPNMTQTVVVIIMSAKEMDVNRP